MIDLSSIDVSAFPHWLSPGGEVLLINADCMAVLPLLPDGYVDAVMTSPPYNTLPTKGSASGMRKWKSGVDGWAVKCAAGYFDSMDEAEYQIWLVRILNECRRICRGLVWVNHKIRYRNGVALHPARIFPWPIYSEVIWDRGGSIALNCKRYAPSTEHLLAFGLPTVWNDSLNTLLSVWRLNYDSEDVGHPCAFPIELAQRPIESSTPPNGIVLDCFAGSGTVGVAAAKCGRKAILIEKEPKYFAIGKRRCEEVLAIGSLFDPASLAAPDLFEETQ